MISADPSTKQSDLCRSAISALLQNGIRDVVVCPGSRSTPLVQAFLEAKNYYPDLKLHSSWHEPSAAFFALGIAKANSRAVVLLCTSGSAVLHFAPAAAEARHSGIPLLILAADRPIDRQDSGAAQTMAQSRALGEIALHHFEIAPASEVNSAAFARTMMQRALRLSSGPRPGPVLVNWRLSKPLELKPSSTEIPLLPPLDLAALHHAEPREQERQALLSRWNSTKTPLIIVGALGSLAETEREALIKEIARLSSGSALYLDPAAELRGDSRLQASLSAAQTVALIDHRAVDFMLILGGECTPTPLQNSIAHSPISAIRLHPFEALDPASQAEAHLIGQLHAFLVDLSPRSTNHSSPKGAPSLGSSTIELNALPYQLGGASNFSQLSGSVSAELSPNSEASSIKDSSPISETMRSRRPQPLGSAGERVPRATASQRWLLEKRTVRILSLSLKEQKQIIWGLGNSLSIRLIEAEKQCFTAEHRHWARRGLSGIEGWLAEFSGRLSCQNSEALGVLLLGDISYLHDLAALPLLAAQKKAGLVILLNNGGGKIFEGLPIADSEASLDWWLTPHQEDLLAYAQAAGIKTQRCHADSAELATFLEAAIATSRAEKRVQIIELDCRTAVPTEIGADRSQTQ